MADARQPGRFPLQINALSGGGFGGNNLINQAVGGGYGGGVGQVTADALAGVAAPGRGGSRAARPPHGRQTALLLTRADQRSRRSPGFLLKQAL